MTRTLYKVCDNSTPTMISTLLILSIATIEDQLCDTRDEVHPVVLHRPVARAEDEEENDRWQDLLDRAHARTNSQIYRRAEHDFDEDSEDYELQENDVLWEVGCKVSITSTSYRDSQTREICRRDRKKQWYSRSYKEPCIPLTQEKWPYLRWPPLRQLVSTLKLAVLRR